MKTPAHTPKCLKNGGFVAAEMQKNIGAVPHAHFQQKSMMPMINEEAAEKKMGGHNAKEDRLEK